MARIMAQELRTKVPQLNCYNIVDGVPAADPNVPKKRFARRHNRKRGRNAFRFCRFGYTIYAVGI